MSDNFALVVNRQQLDILRDALSDLNRVSSPTRKELIKDMHVQLDGLIGNWSGTFDVLGWHPGHLRWTHLFTWSRGAQSGLVRANNENASGSHGFTQFVVIPVPQEGETHG